MIKDRLKTNICGIELKNPVIAASGTFGFGREFQNFIDLNKIGGISVKGLTLKPRKGNAPPRIAETPAGILNSVGLQNPGVHEFIKKEIPFLRQYDLAIITNIAGNTIEEYCEMAEILGSSDIDAIELNVSCPNVKKGGMSFGNSPSGIKEIVKNIVPYCKQPLIVKLTPNVTNIREIALAAQEYGANAVSLINTVLGMSIDVHNRRPVLANNVGGLSGPAVKPIAVRMTYEVAQAVKIPVIGMGGIVNGEDAVEFMLAGASAVMVGTSNFNTPSACIDVINGIEAYMRTYKIENISEIIGALMINK